MSRSEKCIAAREAKAVAARADAAAAYKLQLVKIENDGKIAAAKEARRRKSCSRWTSALASSTWASSRWGSLPAPAVSHGCRRAAGLVGYSSIVVSHTAYATILGARNKMIYPKRYTPTSHS
jgi:hypothetical protein